MDERKLRCSLVPLFCLFSTLCSCSLTVVVDVIEIIFSLCDSRIK